MATAPPKSAFQVALPAAAWTFDAVTAYAAVDIAAARTEFGRADDGRHAGDESPNTVARAAAVALEAAAADTPVLDPEGACTVAVECKGRAERPRARMD